MQGEREPLRQMLLFVNRFIDAMSEAVLVIDQRGLVVAANEAAVALLDLSSKAEALRPLDRYDELITGWSIAGEPFAPSELRQSLAGKTISRQLATIATSAGVEHVVEFTATPIRDEQGQIIVAMLIASDITRERRRMAYLEAVATAAQGISTELDVHRVLVTALDQIEETLGAEAVVCIWRLDQAGPSQEGLSLMACRGLSDQSVALLGMLPLDCPSLICEAAHTRKILYIEDTRKTPPPYELDRQLVEDESLGSWVASPLLSGGKLIGVISYGLSGSHRFYEEDILAITVVSGLFAVAIDHASLYAQSESMRRELDEAGEERLQISQQLLIAGVREQKSAEEADAARQQIASILESISDAFFALDDNLVVTYFNRAAEEILRRKAEEVVGRPFFEVFPEAKGSVFEENYAKAMREKVPLAFETYFALKPYENWYDVRVYPQDNGISVYLQVTTERKRREEELRKWAQVFGHAQWGVAVSSTDGTRLSMVNSAFAKMHGYEVAELAGRPIADVFAPESRAELIEQIRIAHEKGHHIFESKHIRKDGSVFPVLVDVTAVKDEEGNVLYRIANVQDITERKLAEEAIARLASIVDSSGDAIIGKTLDGIVTSWNSGAERLYGYTADEVVGKSVSLIIAPERAEELAEILGRIGRAERIEQYETVRVKKDGTRVGVSVTVSPIRDASGKILGASTIARDISERKKTERFREEYIALISHDLRSPLTVIQGQAQFVRNALERGGQDTLARRGVEAILTSARRMSAMIQDLVDSVRLESGQVHLEKRPVDLPAFVSELLQRVAGVMDVGRIRAELSPDVPTVSADPASLERILVNLISNALKYSPPESEVTIRAGRIDGEALISVTDRGAGIPAEDMPRLFERYFRAKGITKAEGLGLGLYITKGLVEAHGGRIWVESRVPSGRGKGSTFYFTLPIV